MSDKWLWAFMSSVGVLMMITAAARIGVNFTEASIQEVGGIFLLTVSLARLGGWSPKAKPEGEEKRT